VGIARGERGEWERGEREGERERGEREREREEERGIEGIIKV
jgi:hypothetical protein